jgi:hypothetical protein
MLCHVFSKISEFSKTALTPVNIDQNGFQPLEFLLQNPQNPHFARQSENIFTA